MADITIGSFVTGFRDAFSDAATAVACNTTIEAALTLPACVAAQTGTLTTRTDDNTGVATLSTGHGITTGDIVDVYWAEGVRFGMEATVATNAVTVDGGAGDVLPTESTAVTVVEQVVGNVNFDGDDMKMIAVVYRNISDTSAKAHIDFQDASHGSVEELDLVHETASGGLVRTFNVLNITGGDTNTFAGNRVTHQGASHNSLYAATLFIKLGYDA